MLNSSFPLKMSQEAFGYMDADGWTHTDCLYLHSGFNALFWKLLREMGYDVPPQYRGKVFIDNGVPYAEVFAEIPAHPHRPDWPAWEIKVCGDDLYDTWNIAGYRALTKFCEDKLEEIGGYDAAAYPIRDQMNPTWRRRIKEAINPQRADHQTKVASLIHYTIAAHNMAENQGIDNRIHREARRELYQQQAEKDAQVADLTAQLQHANLYANFLEEELQQVDMAVFQLQNQPPPAEPAADDGSEEDPSENEGLISDIETEPDLYNQPDESEGSVN